MDLNWPRDPKNFKLDIQGHGPQGSTHGLWKPTETTRSCPAVFTLDSSEAHPSVMDPTLLEPGMGHTWYYIPLCTIFPCKSNGDNFKNPLLNFRSLNPLISSF
ncbi:hypothetical protein O181_015727 [Austropuccinia psidii MF-1]|uniref:Uncharacterized protein n=1 Tax=Austropuccinia psidii MF-1 TaxID=1389203 RepID=A0A9Q3C485_9BASI|nr:hypothetical protein [Austropuccinia psidii MF-1]